MSDRMNCKYSQDITAADAHDEVEKIADTPLIRVCDRDCLTKTFVFEQSRAGHDQWDQTEAKQRETVQTEVGELIDQGVDDDGGDQGQEDAVPPRWGEHWTGSPLCGRVVDQHQHCVTDNKHTTEHYHNNGERFSKQTLHVVTEGKDDTIHTGDNDIEQSLHR